MTAQPGSFAEASELQHVASIRNDEPGPEPQIVVKPKISLQQVGNIWSLYCMHAYLPLQRRVEVVHTVKMNYACKTLMNYTVVNGVDDVTSCRGIHMIF